MKATRIFAALAAAALLFACQKTDEDVYPIIHKDTAGSETSDGETLAATKAGQNAVYVRAGTLNLKDSYVIAKNGEAYVHSMHISPYDKGNIFNHDPDRPKRLLLHKREIVKLAALAAQDGYALVPLSVYFKDAKVKVELGVCKGKKNYDKRDAAAQRDAKRQIDRAMRERY